MKYLLSFTVFALSVLSGHGQSDSSPYNIDTADYYIIKKLRMPDGWPHVYIEVVATYKDGTTSQFSLHPQVSPDNNMYKNIYKSLKVGERIYHDTEFPDYWRTKRRYTFVIIDSW